MSSVTGTDPVTRASTTEAEQRDYCAEGWVLLRGLLDPAAVAALREDVLAVVGARGMEPGALAQTTEYLADSPIDHLVNSPRLAAVAASLVNGPVRVYMPFTAVKGAHQGPFGFHQDNQYTEHRGPSCNCWFALQDIGPDDGVLQVVSRSHIGGTLPKVEKGEGGYRMYFQPERWDDAVMRAGDCIVFNRLTVHGSAENRSDQPRVAYAVQFHREDTQSYMDGEWRSLLERPRFHTGPVAELSSGDASRTRKAR